MLRAICVLPLVTAVASYGHYARDADPTDELAFGSEKNVYARAPTDEDLSFGNLVSRAADNEEDGSFTLERRAVPANCQRCGIYCHDITPYPGAVEAGAENWYCGRCKTANTEARKRREGGGRRPNPANRQ